MAGVLLPVSSSVAPPSAPDPDFFVSSKYVVKAGKRVPAPASKSAPRFKASVETKSYYNRNAVFVDLTDWRKGAYFVKLEVCDLPAACKWEVFARGRSVPNRDRIHFTVPSGLYRITVSAPGWALVKSQSFVLKKPLRPVVEKPVTYPNDYSYLLNYSPYPGRWCALEEYQGYPNFKIPFLLMILWLWKRVYLAILFKVKLLKRLKGMGMPPGLTIDLDLRGLKNAFKERDV